MVTQLNGRKAPIRLITFRRDVKVEQIKNKLIFMKTLELKSFGLEEMNQNEMMETEGGIFFLLALEYAYVRAVSYVAAAGLVGSFKSGYNQAIEESKH